MIMNRKLLLLSVTTLILVFGVSQRANAETTVYSETGITGTFVVNDGGFQCPDPGKSYYNSDDDYMIVLSNGDFILPWGKIKDYLVTRSLSGSQYNKSIFYFLKDTPYFLFIRLLDPTIKKEDIEGKPNLIPLSRVMTIDFCENTEICFKHNLSDKDVLHFLKERVIQNFKFDKFTEEIGIFISSNHKIIAKYKEGKIVTEEEIQKENEKFAAEEAEREAAEEKKKQAAEKRDIAAFKAKYGFDPVETPLKTVIRSGRSKSVFDAWNNWLKAHDYNIVTTELVYDGGNSKRYYFYYNGTRRGSLWISNGKIDSVSWY